MADLGILTSQENTFNEQIKVSKMQCLSRFTRRRQLATLTAPCYRRGRVAEAAKVDLHKIEQPTTHLFFIRAMGERLLIIGLRR